MQAPRAVAAVLACFTMLFVLADIPAQSCGPYRSIVENVCNQKPDGWQHHIEYYPCSGSKCGSYGACYNNDNSPYCKRNCACFVTYENNPTRTEFGFTWYDPCESTFKIENNVMYRCSPKDEDEDGYTDCDDDNPPSPCDCVYTGENAADINPGANEICGNGIDDNCDGFTDSHLCDPEEEPEPGCECRFSPIIVKLAAGLIRLTNAAQGVWFDLNRDGVIDRVAWTERGDETDAFLALDHNANGIIDDGSELFGNASICGRRSSFKNGFEVLRYLDTPGMGGNFDGTIDSRDAIFPQLLLWVDRNHNGFSEPEELQRFSDHFQAIEWSYEESRRRDRYGNIFRWRAKSYSADGTTRLVWDVILRHQ